ncbi:hypothetical protein [Aureliella helgolandensis]|uniref:Uncharacterized protein n=1 Tax=Aureliella helgolandensis TaxID=2527968 RepID=A0A518G143_9BACT|nr:hypothetical protein [Aureliella helgolandensis]QDV22317.1 hypothetical protein Q31a_06010 [Aureliella helgolandensis]
MSKFYATCGSHTLTISAPSARHAAMRLIDEVMAAHIWIYDDADLSEQDRRDHVVLEALLHLSTVVSVSEIGAGRREAGAFEVPQMIDEWHRLMTGISRMLTSSGIDAGRVLPELPTEVLGPQQPR